MIYIRKNGIFYENGYSPGEEEYVFTKVESFIPYLNEIIHIDSEVTLEDLFIFFEKDEIIINVIFGSAMGHHPLSAYIEDIKKDCLIESREDLDYIECNWVAEQFDYKKFYEKYKNDEKDPILGPLHEPDEDDKNEISIYVDVHGWGKYIPFEGEEENYEEGYAPPAKSSYAIEFTPLYRLKHLPIRLNKTFIIRDNTYDHGKEEKILVEGFQEFTVYEVISEILSEITFSGLPDDRDEKWKDITDRVDEYNEDINEEEDNEEE